ncbi:unnamed protein product (macronuclear) [Paramecium tetraurelia]|uniref:Transmembrane protein n=1 Tax=Paramecium tetraurelia TaxID=5888 RepID=A0C070_PARTE|nr:uncharacterized protein GSPATT00006040001 [Paramecium tetraurelia]CAK64187.1 unnamed protein product [Paramecium tetraurelia]|eukprot:XP_001431585.1 hypothetical protein (macronuclear) [Paramecium tetraurelia strain d4-2]
MNSQFQQGRSQSIKFIQTQTVYEQPFFTPNIDILSVSENLYLEKISKQATSRDQSPRKWQESHKKPLAQQPKFVTPQEAPKEVKIIQVNNDEKKIQTKEVISKPTTEHKQLIGRAKVLLLQQRTLNMKKYFKIASLAIIAAIRIKKSLNYSLWKKYQTQLKNITFFLKLELVQTERINAWCKAVCAKSLTSVNQQLHNFIEYPNDKEQVDQSMMKSINSCQFLLENLAYFSQPKYFCEELKYYLLSQVFLDHKAYFSKFVSNRTLYLHTRNRQIKQEELTMILVESILIDQVLVNIFDSNQKCVFLHKVLASLLQYLFIKKFDKLKQKRNNIQKLSAHQVISTENRLKLNQIPNPENNDLLIIGLYKDEDMLTLLNYKKTAYKKIDQNFERFCCNLYTTILA